MSYWKLLGITLGAIFLDFVIAIFLIFAMSKFSLVSSQNAPSYFTVFLALGMFVLSYYNFKKGAIITADFGRRFVLYRPGKDFYFQFWFQIVIFSLILLLGLYGIIISYLA